MRKDNSKKPIRSTFFLLPHQIEYLNRFSFVRKATKSEVLRDILEDYVSGKTMYKGEL